MKFTAIAALVATASAADVAQYAKCTKDDKCTTATDCCGTVETLAADKLTAGKGYVVMKASVKVDVCFTKDAKTFTKAYTADKKAADGDLFATKDTDKTVEGSWKCLATTGASHITAAAAVLAASFYMA